MTQYRADQLDDLVRIAETAARAGGEIVTQSFGLAENIREKAPGDWVSDVDMSSEHTIQAALAFAAPDIPFFGEETGVAREALAWVVDPLDGTANFLHGFPSVGVSVALVEDGTPVVGVVHAPLLGNTYTCRVGGGAFCNGKPIRVSERAPQSAIVATGFPFRAKQERLSAYLPVMARALVDFEDLRRAGAASLDLAWTAAGVFDGYFEQALGTWDVAAGGLLVREAGGVTTDWSGDDRTWLESGDIVVGPPQVHEKIVELTAQAATGGGQAT